MRKFIISDLHGNGEVYDSVMAYLENVALTDEVELTINGDLIDFGEQSLSMFLDVRDRILGRGNVKIRYLGGNHELMMYQALKNRIPGKAINHFSNWMMDGGSKIEGEIDSLKSDEEAEKILKVLKDFSGSLGVLHVYDEKILGRPILLVHGQAPSNVSKVQSMKIEDDNEDVFCAVWNREIKYGVLGFPMGKQRVGNPNYFTIVGHYPVSDNSGFHYYNTKDDSFFRIDGGCHPYTFGNFSYDHVPLVEVKDNYLDILVFNHNNEIINGYTFDGKIKPMAEIEVNINRLLLDPALNGNGEANKKLIMEFKKDGIL